MSSPDPRRRGALSVKGSWTPAADVTWIGFLTSFPPRRPHGSLGEGLCLRGHAGRAEGQRPAPGSWPPAAGPAPIRPGPRFRARQSLPTHGFSVARGQRRRRHSHLPLLARCGMHRAAQRALPNELPWPIKWSYKIGTGSSRYSFESSKSNSTHTGWWSEASASLSMRTPRT